MEEFFVLLGQVLSGYSVIGLNEAGHILFQMFHFLLKAVGFMEVIDLLLQFFNLVFAAAEFGKQGQYFLIVRHFHLFYF